MTIATLFSYLFGSRAAILRIATTRGAVWIGALLVLSAGFAREYDAADLTADPWRLLIPFGASFGTCFLLYCLVYLAASRRTVNRPPFASTFVTFLSLYWMTAPLAWLYALPVERFLSAGNATKANLCLLGLVSIWRVTLMTRAVHVLFGARLVAAFWLVMLFADTVVIAILYFSPIPILNVMGGIRLSDSERVILDTALLIGIAGVLSWLVWLCGACMIIANGTRDWQRLPVESMPSNGNGKAIWGFASAAILVWGLVLPFTQPEQQLRSDVELSLGEGDIAGAIQRMSRHQRRDFPPHWSPPPHLAFANPQPPLLDVLEVVLNEDAAPWVRGIFVEKLAAELASSWSFRSYPSARDASQRDRLLTIIERLPEGISLVSKYPRAFAEIAMNEPEPLRDRVRALLAKAGLDLNGAKVPSN